MSLVQEMFGYCLTAETRAHKALFLDGAGRNGKSVLLGVVAALVGKENCSAVPVAQLTNDFARSDLYGKTVNLTTGNEVDPKAVNTPSLKAVVSGDTFRANVKYERAFTFRPTVKFAFAANNLPYSHDRSFGYLQRMIVVPFNRQCLGSKANKPLTESLRKELPGVLNWAVEGAPDEFKANLSLVFWFVDDCIVQSLDGREANNTVRDTYAKRCSMNGHEHFGKTTGKSFWKSFRTALSEKRIPVQRWKETVRTLPTGSCLYRSASGATGQSIGEVNERLHKLAQEAGLNHDRDWRQRKRPSRREQRAVDDLFTDKDESETNDCDVRRAETLDLQTFVDGELEELEDVRETYLRLVARASDPSLEYVRSQKEWDGDLSKCPSLSVKNAEPSCLFRPIKSA